MASSWAAFALSAALACVPLGAWAQDGATDGRPGDALAPAGALPEAGAPPAAGRAPTHPDDWTAWVEAPAEPANPDDWTAAARPAPAAGAVPAAPAPAAQLKASKKGAGQATTEGPRDNARDPQAPADDNGGEGAEGGGFSGYVSEGFKVVSTPLGVLSIGAYGLWRYLNQSPESNTFVDHLGRVRDVTRARNDLEWHRALVHFRGWLFNPRFVYQTSVWGLQSSEQMSMVGYLGYRFSDSFILAGGINSLPGSVTLLNNHPFWLGTDRVMVNEFMRPGFTGGAWIFGDLPHRMWYRVMVGNTISQLGLNSFQLTKDLASSVHLGWFPTTGEYGPKGGLGDFEGHEKAATRFGVSYTHSREDRAAQPSLSSPENVQIRLSDSVLLFETGSLAPKVTVKKANYNLLAMDAGVKHKGFSFDTELYYRWLDTFRADGPLPLSTIRDSGLFIQTAKMVKRRLLMLYGFGSFVNGQFNNSWELGSGLNYFPFHNRNVRVNFQGLYVNKCPTSSQFGYYIGGMTGPIFSLATDILF